MAQNKADHFILSLADYTIGKKRILQHRYGIAWLMLIKACPPLDAVTEASRLQSCPAARSIKSWPICSQQDTRTSFKRSTLSQSPTFGAVQNTGKTKINNSNLYHLDTRLDQSAVHRSLELLQVITLS